MLPKSCNAWWAPYWSTLATPHTHKEQPKDQHVGSSFWEHHGTSIARVLAHHLQTLILEMSVISVASLHASIELCDPPVVGQPLSLAGGAGPTLNQWIVLVPPSGLPSPEEQNIAAASAFRSHGLSIHMWRADFLPPAAWIWTESEQWLKKGWY